MRLGPVQGSAGAGLLLDQALGLHRGDHARTLGDALHVRLPVLLGAAWAHAGNGWLFSSPNGGWEYPVFMAFSAIAAALLGDGRYALRSTTPAPRLAAA